MHHIWAQIKKKSKQINQKDYNICIEDLNNVWFWVGPVNYIQNINSTALKHCDIHDYFPIHATSFTHLNIFVKVNMIKTKLRDAYRQKSIWYWSWEANENRHNQWCIKDKHHNSSGHSRSTNHSPLFAAVPE